jgi:hypothetical protein
MLRTFLTVFDRGFWVDLLIENDLRAKIQQKRGIFFFGQW